MGRGNSCECTGVLVIVFSDIRVTQRLLVLLYNGAGYRVTEVQSTTDYRVTMVPGIVHYSLYMSQ